MIDVAIDENKIEVIIFGDGNVFSVSRKFAKSNEISDIDAHEDIKSEQAAMDFINNALMKNVVPIIRPKENI